MTPRRRRVLLIAAMPVAALAFLGANYPSQLTQTALEIITSINGGCSSPINGSCVDLSTNAAFLVGHNASGTEKAAHFDAIPGPMIASGTQDIGTLAAPWDDVFANQLKAIEVDGTANDTTVQLQGGTTPGDVTVFEDQTSVTQRKLVVYGPNVSTHTDLYNDATQGYLTASGGALNIQTTGAGDVNVFPFDVGGNSFLRVYDGLASANYLRLGHDGTDGVISQIGGAGKINIQTDLKLSATISSDISSTTELTVDDVRTPVIPLSLADGSTTWDTAWSSNLTSGRQAIFNALNYLADNISGAATLQGAYDNGQTITLSSAGNLILDAESNSVRITNADNVADPTPGTFQILGSSTPLDGAQMWFQSDRFVINNMQDGPITMYCCGSGGEFTVDPNGVTLIDGASGDALHINAAVASTEAGYEHQITSAAGQNVAYESSAAALLKGTSSTIVDSGAAGSTRIGARGGSVYEVAIGNSGDRDSLHLYGLLTMDTYTNGPSGSSSFSSSTTKVVTNASVTSTSQVFVTPTSQPAGMWWVTKADGVSFTVHSTASETATGFDWIVIQ